jgi:hypothetical protein
VSFFLLDTTSKIPLLYVDLAELVSASVGSRIRGMFNSLFLSLYGDPRAIFGHNPLRFYCKCCGKEHKKRKCPGCGSMAVIVG